MKSGFPGRQGAHRRRRILFAWHGITTAVDDRFLFSAARRS
jgi:hypothetical protein